MDWLRASAGILLVIVLAFVLGWTQYVKSRATKAFIWIGTILLLLAVRFFDGQPFTSLALSLLVLLDALKHIPPWFIRTVVALCAVFFIRYVLVLIAQSLQDIGQQIDKTNARIDLMESSITRKLDDIASRLPEN